MTEPAQAAGAARSLRVSGLLEATIAYLRLLAVDIDRDQLVAGLPVADGRLDEALLSRAVERLDFVVQWHAKNKLDPEDLPCCARLASGGFVVLLERSGDAYWAIDGGDERAIRQFPAEQLDRLYSGRFFRLAPSIVRLQKQHSVVEEDGHWFWRRVLGERVKLLDIVLSSLFANILAITVSMFALQVYDRVLPGESEATLWVLAAGAMLAIAFEGLLRMARARLIDTMGRDSEIEITRDIFARFVGMRMDKLPAPPGALVHMVREFAAVREFFTTAAVGVVADLPFVVIFLALIYLIAGDVVWVVAAGAAATILPSLLLRGRMARLAKESMGGMSSASRLLTEAAYGAETVKVSRAEVHFQRQWEEIIALNAVKTTDQRSINAFLTHWAASAQQATYVAAVIAGVYMVFAREFTMGAIIAVSILSTRTLNPITQLSQVLSRWENMKTALDGLDVIMASEQERDVNRTYLRRPRLRGAIELRNVKFAHQGGKVASLSIPSLAIEPGRRLALLGANGSGKSTLLRVLAGLYAPNEGEVLVDGLDIRQIDPADLRKNIGYLPQEIRLFKGSLRENLAMDGRRHSDDKLLAALAFGGLGEFARQHPEGLDAMILDGGEGFSIGQKQSIGLARMFLLDPSIVLLDEPTAALDQGLEDEVVRRLGDWLGLRTCVVATHRMPILSRMNRIAVLQQGRVAMEGERDAVLKRIAQPQPQPQPQSQPAPAGPAGEQVVRG